MLGEDIYLWMKVLLNELCYCEKTPLGWYHTESSELNFKPEPQPIPAYLTHSDNIIARCPIEYLVLIRELLSLLSINHVYHQTSLFFKQSSSLLSRHPSALDDSLERFFFDQLAQMKVGFKEFSSDKFFRLLRGPEIGGPWY